MEDKTFELLEKMYSEFAARFDKVDSRLDNLEAGQKKMETILEHDIKTNLQSLHERAAINTDKLQEHSERLNTIDNKLDYIALAVNSQDKRLEVVESSKRRKA